MTSSKHVSIVPKFNNGYCNLQPVFNTEMAFAEDIAMLTKDARTVEFIIKIWIEEMVRISMTNNVKNYVTCNIKENNEEFH